MVEARFETAKGIKPNQGMSLDYAQEFAQLRDRECAEEIEKLPVDVRIVSPIDNKQDFPPAHPTITREDIEGEVARTTSESLEKAGFDPSQGLPDVDTVRRLAKEGVFDGIGTAFTASSEVAKLWHQKTAYSPLALAPQYNGEHILPLPVLRDDGSAPKAEDPDRELAGFIPVAEDDPARAAWRYHPDPIEVRKRGEHLKNKIIDYCEDDSMTDSEVRIAAVAGGAAWPDIRAVASLSQTQPDLKVTLDVFDWDKAAMTLGVRDAQEILSAVSGNVEVAEDKDAKITTITAGGNVTVRFIDANITDQEKLVSHAKEDGRDGYNIVEAVGLVEYFPQEAAPFVINNMDALLKSDHGRGIVANMTRYHDYMQILGVIGWRALRPRSIEDINRFVDEGLTMKDPSRKPSKQLELLDRHSYLFVSWDK